MKGKYRIIIQNKKIKYDFEIKRNITVIRGDSATGKTALVDMIREYSEFGADSGIDLQCSKECTVLEGRNWKIQLSAIQDSIIFIDEGNPFVASTDFASEIQKTDNYYVIVTRESLSALPYSVNEIYGIRNSGKYGHLKQTYNELYQIYGTDNFKQEIKPEKIITEDSNSGFQFFDELCKNNGLRCITANGKSNIFKCLERNDSEKILVIADGAAFGAEIDRIMQMIKIQNNVVLYLPESFEWIVLQSGLINDENLEAILESPCEYIESKEYFSWERYFTDLLMQKTEDTYLQYTKRTLNKTYLQKTAVDKIIKVMKMINFK